jgi:hypothetical protein
MGLACSSSLGILCLPIIITTGEWSEFTPISQDAVVRLANPFPPLQAIGQVLL